MQGSPGQGCGQGACAAHELQQARELAEERLHELTQLQEVSVQADAALQQCLAQLRVRTAVLLNARHTQFLRVWW